MPQFISPPDSSFDRWLEGLVGFLVGRFEDPVGKLGERETLAEAVREWGSRYKACVEAQSAAAQARAAKDLTRGMIEEITRHYTQKLGRVEGEQAAHLIPVVKSDICRSKVIERPVLRRMEVSTPLVVRLFFVEIGERNAMPPGIQFCEVRCQVGGQCPTDPETLPVIAFESRPPYRADFAAGDAGRLAWLAFRWVNHDGEAGLWSEIYSTVVPG
ncbi:MAG: hypothetical protein JWL59_2892 [Chthoniobacteraceae bacterium]|nr:hypothetical protein [Chthoniobacteraceae bacterium]